MLNYDKQIARLENRLVAKNDIPTAAILALRYWQASRFSAPQADAGTLIQRANHAAVTVHRLNPAHVDMFVLTVFITIEAGHYDSAAEMLDKAMGHKSFLRVNAPRQYTQLCFLQTYLSILTGQTRFVKKHWRALTDHIQAAAPSTEDTIMLGLLHLASEEFDEAFGYLREAFRNGSSSIFLYEGLYRYYSTTPTKPKSGVILAVLIYAASRGVDITNIALRHHDALIAAALSNPEAGEDLFKLCGYLPLLQSVCANRMAKNDVSRLAYSYYKQAEEKQVVVDGLYDFLVNAAYQNSAGEISHYAISQFLKTEKMKPDLEIYVYHLLITVPALADLLQAQLVNVLGLTEDCMEAGVSGREVNSLYHYYWLRCKKRGITNANVEKAEEILSQSLAMYEVTTGQNSGVRHIYVTGPEMRGMTVYDLPENDNTILLQVSSPGFSYTCLGAGRRTILDETLIIKCMIPGASTELYQHFFDKGDRRFYLLSYLSNHYLQQENLSDAAIPVFEAVLAEKAISKAYRVRILVALGRLYFNMSDFDRALEYYNEADEDALDKGLEMLSIYLQTNETARAAELIANRHTCIPGEVLQDAIHTLLALLIDHAPLAEAGYCLLMNGFYNQKTLSLALSHYNASYSEWVALAQKLDDGNITDINLDTRILETALWMAQWDDDVQKAFVRVCKSKEVGTAEIIEEFIEYATYELFANFARPEYDTLYILEEKCLTEPENTLLLWAVAGCYLRHSITTFKSDEILEKAIKALEDENILFPVFKANKFALVPFIEKHQSFIYHGAPGKNYCLHYRIDDAAQFTSTPMEYVKYGIYVACLPMFYNEEVTYYFSEELPTGSIATKEETLRNITPFLFDHQTDKFFTINNAIINEQMFKYDQVEQAVSDLIKDVQMIRSKLL
ncbi:MAG: DUF5717 family protein [Firmicutes bacterium]|nr:DUF5717 family protein [Bacillota bacterium]